MNFDLPFSCQQAVISIADPAGKICHTETVTLKGKTNHPLSVEKLNNGIYFVEARLSKSVWRQKLIINR